MDRPDLKPVETLKREADALSLLAITMRGMAAESALLDAIGPDAFQEFLDRTEAKIATELGAMLDQQAKL